MLMYRGHRYVLAHPGEFDYKKLEKQLAQLIKQARSSFASLVRPNGAARQLAVEANKLYPDDSKAMRAYWREAALENAEIKTWVRMTSLSDAEKSEKILLGALESSVFGLKLQKDAWASINRWLSSTFISETRESARSHMYDVGFTRELVEKVFPKPFAFRVGPGGKIEEELSIFGNSKRTFKVKSAAMSVLLENWNKLVDALNRDLQSTDPFKKLCAIVASIVAHTGIRPGGESESIAKESGKRITDENGNFVKVKTVGATGLKPEHIKFLRDDFVRLKFVGKAATVNIADIKGNAALVSALQEQIAAVQTYGDKKASSIFVTADGREVTDADLLEYFRSIVGQYIQTADFRKLRATREYYAELRDNKLQLVTNLKDITYKTEAEMRSKIVDTIVNYMLNAAKAAQKAISHESLETTINSYIETRTTLTYLVNKGLEQSLDIVVANGKKMLVRFDAIDFFETVTGGFTRSSGQVSEASAGGTMFFIDEPFTDTPLYELEEGLV